VRAFVARALAECPAREALLTCVSELAANAIAHTASGAGGVFTVEVVRPAVGVALVAVTDAGSPREPAMRQQSEPADPWDLAEGGRGLALIAALSSRWGFRDAYAGDGTGRVVWAEATWPVAVRAKRLPLLARRAGNRFRLRRAA
jgi:anti-sigma regulatory factor (Ser/Thr protein kinase)